MHLVWGDSDAFEFDCFLHVSFEDDQPQVVITANCGQKSAKMPAKVNEIGQKLAKKWRTVGFGEKLANIESELKGYGVKIGQKMY